MVKLVPSAVLTLPDPSVTLFFYEFISDMHFVKSLLLSFIPLSEGCCFEKQLMFERELSSFRY